MRHPLQIGSLTLGTPLLLAPLAGYADLSFRLVARGLGGVGLACTDLLCPEGVLRESPRLMESTQTTAEDAPLAMQVYGAEAGRLCAAALWAVERGADVIDLNMGCPVDKITKRDGGSALLCKPDEALRLAEKIRRALPAAMPLTVKLRLGWDDGRIVAPYLAPRLEDLGVAAITIHGRTTDMLFSGAVRLEAIGEVVASVKSIPVIGNGDIRTPGDAARMLERTGCAGVMIGRAALAAPWIFRDTWAWLSAGRVLPEPTLTEKVGLIRAHFYHLARYRHARVAVLEFRKRISWYAKTMNPCRPLRDGMRRINSVEDFERVLEEFLEWRGEVEERVAAGRSVASAAAG